MAPKHRGIRGPRQLTMSKILRHHRNQTFWAEGGMIHVVDETDGDYKAVTYTDWLARIVALRNAIARMPWADDRADLQTLVEDMIMIGKQARAQGDPCRPLTPQERREGLAKARELMQKKRQTSIVVPGNIGNNPNAGKIYIP